jgi:hypothetical protein
MADETKNKPPGETDPYKASPELAAELEKLGVEPRQTSLSDPSMAAQGAFRRSTEELEQQAYLEALLSRGEFEWRREVWSLTRDFATYALVGAGAYLAWWLFFGRRA